MASRAGHVAGLVTKYLLRAVWVATMILTPLFGFWLASSLAAYENATQWLALLVGLLLFPILPVGWDLFYAWRRSKQEPKKAILTRLDRLVLRTLLINGVFLAITLYFAHATAFRALAVRGDWMLDGHHGPIATEMRSWLLAFADKLDKRRIAHLDYGPSDKAPDPWEHTKQPEPPKPTPTESKPLGEWPLPAAADPIVTEMPEAMQTSIESVGQYLASRFTDKKQLVKAIHDYVVLRMSYDYNALERIMKHDYANTPSQDAEDVFARKTAVCAGYARLMVALGKAANVEIAYVTGYIRDSTRRLALDSTGQPNLEGVSHAWNAVKIDDSWYLIDATWNDPTNGSPTTTYLFTPPKLMTYDHLPEDSAWQLRSDPITLGDFVRQPLLSPSIGEYGLELVAPTRSQITVDGDAEIVLANPQDAAVSAVARRDGEREGKDTRCNVKTANQQTRVTCELPAGEWDVQLYAAHQADTKSGRYSLAYVGSILVNSH
jgi:transglutaminase-like putative cysteine protease